MRTYQDLVEVGDSDLARIGFCEVAVNAFRGSAEYKKAYDGEMYFEKHNVTLEKYKKTLRTLTGREVEDIFSPNNKIRTLFFRRLITQQVQYVLGNGLTLGDSKNKEKLGKDFDFQLQYAAKHAMASGKSFGFWNLDHLEVFGYCDTDRHAGFCPLYDEMTGELMAGIRYWYKKVGNDIIARYTLYEEDGYTEFKKVGHEEGEVLQTKRGYIRNVTKRADGIIEDITDENYGRLPIVPLYANDEHESELEGMRDAFDAYDLIKSGLANDIDDDGLYWTIKNTGGMDDVDLAKFLQRLRTVRAAYVDDSVDVSAHENNIPINARQYMLELLRKDIYEDFQMLDVNTLSAAAKTTQEIQAAYQAQDDKCADFEYHLLRFVDSILELAGIDDNPTFVWNKVVNQAEQTNMILSAGSYIGEEAVIKHLPFITPEEADEIIAKMDEQDFNRFHEDEEVDDVEEDVEEDEE